LQACKRKEYEKKKEKKKEKTNIKLLFNVVAFREDVRECSTIISVQ
jgi:hypothetical protein